jgi:hypothetical protein
VKAVVPYDDSVVGPAELPIAASIALERVVFLVPIDKENISPSSISAYIELCAIREDMLYSSMAIRERGVRRNLILSNSQLAQTLIWK